MFFAAYTHFFQITEGVEVIRSIYPFWKGTKSGLLWPAVFWIAGLVNPDGEASFVERDEEKSEEEPVMSKNKGSK